MTGSLTGGTLLARNVVTNLIGWLLPAIVALVAVPLLVRGMGDARFGFLTLAWTTFGYFSLFDLGIGRALTHAVADRLGRGAEGDVAAVAWTALALIVPAGFVGTAVLWFAGPWLIDHALKMPAELRTEGLQAFRILALAIPFTTATAALRGILEANQRFGLVNALRVPYGVLTFAGPLAALPFSASLVPAVAVLTSGRVVLFVAHLWVCSAVLPRLREFRWIPGALGPLVTFGGWMTVSNVVSPLMNTLDRFIVGAALSMNLVAYYATPHEVVTKMWLFTAALLPVFFPAFATSAVGDPARTAALFDRVLRATFAALFLPTLALVLLGREILGVWLGPVFATNSAPVMQVLAIAIFVNTLGQGALTLIQGLGRPDLTGKYHLFELPIYAALLWWLLPKYGIVGVAAAWAIRAIADSIVLLLTCPVLLPEAHGAVRRIFIWIAIALPVLAASAWIPTVAGRVVTFAIAAPLWGALAWWGILTPVERSTPMRLLGTMGAR